MSASDTPDLPETLNPNADYPTLVSSWVGETIAELEATLFSGTLSDLIERPDVQEVIGPELVERYRTLATQKLKHEPAFRSNWTRRFVEVFQAGLQAPKKVFPAKAAPGSGRRDEWSASKTPSVVASYYRDEVVLRPDQVLSARRWGNWFEFEDELLKRAYNEFLVIQSLQLLASNITNLGSIEATLVSGFSNPGNRPTWNAESRGDQFEHLMLDVLNELTQSAEVNLERSAHRISHATVRLKRGSQLEVSKTIDPEFHACKNNALYSPGKFILLTPLELARFAIHPPAIQQFEVFPWDAFWTSFAGKHHDENAFAQELLGLFDHAVTSPLVHPLGPMWILPPQLRAFVRAFIEHRAAPAAPESPLLELSKQRSAIQRRLSTTASPRGTDPDVDYPTLVVGCVREIITELEAGIHNGSLAELIQRADVREVLGPALAERYRVIAAEKVKHDPVFRSNWMVRFSERFQQSLQSPSKLFPAKAAVRQWSVEGKSPPSLVVTHGQLTATVRRDQALSARVWGIWFSFEDELLERFYMAFLVSNALRHLALDVKNLWNIEATYLSQQSNLGAESEWHSEKWGARFEHLMLDVLNESVEVAKPAPLAEDILERTDLRVTYPSVKRNNGSRVQVSLAADPEIHDRKVHALRVPREFIILTPLELARCAVHPPTCPQFTDFPWSDFWTPLGGPWRDVHALAQELHDLFIQALYCPLGHPLGPMWLLSSSMRQFIRVFTEHRAVATTNCVRERLKTSRRRLDSVDKYTGSNWKAKFTKATAKAGSVTQESTTNPTGKE